MNLRETSTAVQRATNQLLVGAWREMMRAAKKEGKRQVQFEIQVTLDLDEQEVETILIYDTGVRSQIWPKPGPGYERSQDPSNPEK